MICKRKREGAGQDGRGSGPRFGLIWAGEFGSLFAFKRVDCSLT